MGSRVTRKAGFAGMAALLALAPAAAYGGGTDRIHVEIKPLAHGKARYSGAIESPDHGCVVHRTVKLGTDGARLVRARTGRDGEFKRIGRAPKAGDQLNVTVPARGECPKLTGTSTFG